MLSIFITYIVSLCLYLVYILKGNKFALRQTERALGLKTHQNKNGTITAGGIIFVLVSSIIFISKFKLNLKTLFLILPFLSYFLLGFIDDFLIIKFKKNDGLSPLFKLVTELILALIFYFIYHALYKKTTINLGMVVDLKLLFIPFFILLFASSANSFNITDGVDGLLISLSIAILLSFFIISYQKEDTLAMSLIITVMAAMGSFYFFNYQKACLFMGDTGSLAIGALITSLAFYLDIIGFYLIVAIPLFWEVISVIIQVTYFKITKGKRIFKMAPYHHHLETLGFSESFVKTMFLFVETILILLALTFFGYI